MAHKLRIPVMIAVFIIVAWTCGAALLVNADSSGASVNILNAGTDPILVHCGSKDSDLGAKPVDPGSTYSWDFRPNIFGMTLYSCEFFWKTFTQNFQVWKGSYYDNRPPCAVEGPCNYKVTPDGFFYGLQPYENSNNSSTTIDQIWSFYQPWVRISPV